MKYLYDLVIGSFKALFLLLLLGFLFFSVAPKLLFDPETFIIYRFQIQNQSGEPVTCAAIGWYPAKNQVTIWEPAPNVRGPGHGIRLDPGQETEIALSTSDFCDVQLLVRGKTATETRLFAKNVHEPFVIPRLTDLPLATTTIIPCFEGEKVALPATQYRRDLSVTP